MANDLVVQLGAKLDQFAADMNTAGDMADSAISRIESSFASLNPGASFAGLGTIATGAAASIAVLLTALQHVNSELADISKNAEYVGVSVERFQSLQFAATQGGVSSGQAVNDLRNVARLLADAKENENSLTKLLDANNIKYEDRNGDIIGTNKLLQIAGDLINRFHSMPEKVEAAKALGLSEAWVKALHDGSKAFDDVANSADSAGAVIDKSTIAKAEAFDTAWKKSSALLSSQFKAATGDIAGWFDDLINKANQLIEASAKANAPANPGGANKFADWADSLVISARIDDGTASVKDLERAIEIIAGHDQIVPQALFDQLTQLKIEAAAAAKQIDEVNRATQASNFPNGVPSPRARPASADDTSDSDARLANRKPDNGVRDPFEAATDLANKRIAVLNAETATIGQNTEARERAKVVATLEEAAKRSNTAAGKENTDVTDEQRTAINKTADAMLAAAKARANSRLRSRVSTMPFASAATSWSTCSTRPARRARTSARSWTEFFATSPSRSCRPPSRVRGRSPNCSASVLPMAASAASVA
jgi:hypothetical protein